MKEEDIVKKTYRILRENGHVYGASENHAWQLYQNEDKPECPECMDKTSQEEMNMFGGLCETCSE